MRNALLFFYWHGFGAKRAVIAVCCVARLGFFVLYLASSVIYYVKCTIIKWAQTRMDYLLCSWCRCSQPSTKCSVIFLLLFYPALLVMFVRVEFDRANGPPKWTATMNVLCYLLRTLIRTKKLNCNCELSALSSVEWEWRYTVTRFYCSSNIGIRLLKMHTMFSEKSARENRGKNN